MYLRLCLFVKTKAKESILWSAKRRINYYYLKEDSIFYLHSNFENSLNLREFDTAMTNGGVTIVDVECPVSFTEGQ